jgi:predicted RNA binding protein YcfA (HicA-like mRNA interferase family)
MVMSKEVNPSLRYCFLHYNMNKTALNKVMQEASFRIDEAIINVIEPKIYELIEEYMNDITKQLDEIYKEITIVNKDYVNSNEYLTTDQMKEILISIGKFKQLSEDVNNVIENRVTNIVTKIIMENDTVTYYTNEFSRFRLAYVYYGKKKEINIINLMIKNLNNKIRNYINDVIKESIQYIIDAYEVSSRQIIETVEGIRDSRLLELAEIKQKENELTNSEDKKSSSKLLDQYELEKLTIENGYTFSRQTGSHKIFTKENGKNIIIPQHTKELGKGLSLKIQKDLQN